MNWQTLSGKDLRKVADDWGVVERAPGETDADLRRRISAKVHGEPLGTLAHVTQVVHDTVPSYVRFTITEAMCAVLVDLDEPIWRRLFFLARRDRRRVKEALSDVLAAHVSLSVY